MDLAGDTLLRDDRVVPILHVREGGENTRRTRTRHLLRIRGRRRRRRRLRLTLGLDGEQRRTLSLTTVAERNLDVEFVDDGSFCNIDRCDQLLRPVDDNFLD